MTSAITCLTNNDTTIAKCDCIHSKTLKSEILVF